MLLTLEEIKAHCRLEADFNEEDSVLDLIGQAVAQRTETFLNRKLYLPNEKIPPDDENGLHLRAEIKMAMLLLASHYYFNRTASSDFEKSELPMGFIWNVQPYRIIPL
ncbi:head-tail connector protein [Candidatus Williamhamiltonella defendens]|uniref:head-tail connector protein n=1 Tax=Candidatus Williamhamiltonella defendens TaxID=138072 RepID=UPI001581D62E|nr:head-tail connector protein [Candidatus Hamiltonella defensa]